MKEQASPSTEPAGLIAPATKPADTPHWPTRVRQAKYRARTRCGTRVSIQAFHGALEAIPVAQYIETTANASTIGKAPASAAAASSTKLAA